jgi:hypothetical protein
MCSVTGTDWYSERVSRSYASYCGSEQYSDFLGIALPAIIHINEREVNLKTQMKHGSVMN